MLATVLATLDAGCSTVLAVRGQQAMIQQNAVVGGTVRTADHQARGPLIVALIAKNGDGYRLVDHFVAEKPGAWILSAAPGTYWVAAFEDVNGDGRYEDEPALRPDPADAITLGAGMRRDDLDIAISADGRLRMNGFSIDELQARDRREQQDVSLYALSAIGEVTTLGDPRFSREIASSGIWKPYDFLLHTQPGIYFLEPYDPKRTPVLFVHGIGGTPTEFASLIASLDRRKFQPWVVYYPSGANLDVLGQWLTQIFVRLRTTYHFERVAVVAYSMGGLVSREFILDDYAASHTSVVRTYVTISSPFGGMEWAAKGVERSPVVVSSWRGLATNSAFLDGLFYSDVPRDTVRRALPGHVAYHMIFGFRGGGSGGSSDGVVPVASQLRSEAQQEARSVRGFDETHSSVLTSNAVSARLGEILAEIR